MHRTGLGSMGEGQVVQSCRHYSIFFWKVPRKLPTTPGKCRGWEGKEKVCFFRFRAARGLFIVMGSCFDF